MHDKIDLKNLRLPRSNHVLSIVFENLVKQNYKKEQNKIIIKLNNKEYRGWLGDKKKKVVHVEEYEDGYRIYGGELKHAVINSHGDHRIAMSFSIAGLIIQSPKPSVNSSFPIEREISCPPRLTA